MPATVDLSRIPVPAWTPSHLAAFGDAPALITATQTVTYADLATRVTDTVELLGPTRRLLLLAAHNDVETVVTYLAGLAGGHCVLLVPGRGDARLNTWGTAYDPDVVCEPVDGALRLEERREGTAHDLHADLALLLSTSGSTGSPKLARLSQNNIASNAASIAEYLQLGPGDRAALTLPLSYCYGLSVLNSHLLVGAGVVVTEQTVLDAGFWDLFAASGATSFAGVPYTFELLERSGWAERDLPSLRYVTQAGGRLDPELVVRFSRLGRRRGWDFYVMYGQTEATSRMAYLPPHLAADHPGAIGVPIPGGSLRLEPSPESDEPDSGELVYSGPNVMLGYCESPSDLAAGRVLTELRTGDLARRRHGLYEIIGRKSRFAKAFGLRVNLDELERVLSRHAITGWSVTHDERLHVFVTRPADVRAASTVVAAECGLPAAAVTVASVHQRPETPAGKTDYAALERQAAALAGVTRRASDRRAPTTAGELRDLYASLLGRPDATVDDSFVSLGGDSLSYVELSVRIGELLPDVPRDWHTRSVRELAARPVTARRGAVLETSVVLRAVAIVLVVGTHSNVFSLYGGAHILLGVAGYNFARFQVTRADPAVNLHRGVASIAAFALPSAVWIAGLALTTDFYDLRTALFLNGLLGSDTWTTDWQLWFLEALVWSLAGCLTMLRLPGVGRLERRDPWTFAVSVVAAALLVRYAVVGVEAGPTERYTTLVVFWCFALGWAIAASTRHWQRVVVSVLAVLSVAGFFGEPTREALVVTCLLLLVWLPGVHLPAAVTVVLGLLASASLYIYLTHWQVYPHLEVDHPLLALLTSLGVGIATERLARPIARWAGARRQCAAGHGTR